MPPASAHILVLPDTLSDPPETICHQHTRSDEVHGGPEASSRQVALVLYGAVAAGWRHVLRHSGRLLFVVQWVVKTAVYAET
jgi:hypothetical protein